MKQLLCHCQGWSEESPEPLVCDGLTGSQPAPAAPRSSWLRRATDRAVPRADLTLMHEVHTKICLSWLCSKSRGWGGGRNRLPSGRSAESAVMLLHSTVGEGCVAVSQLRQTWPGPGSQLERSGTIWYQSMLVSGCFPLALRRTSACPCSYSELLPWHQGDGEILDTPGWVELPSAGRGLQSVHSTASHSSSS